MVDIVLYILAAIGSVCVACVVWFYIHETWLSLHGESGPQILSNYLDSVVADMQADYARGFDHKKVDSLVAGMKANYVQGLGILPTAMEEPRTIDRGTIRATPLKMIEGKR